jgi:hypothetical protein
VLEFCRNYYSFSVVGLWISTLVSLSDSYHSPPIATVRLGVRPVGILVVGEGRKGGRDEISQNSGLCEHL